ncbi:MAG: Dyp-type peroxidase [Frankia sp.]
MTGPDPADASAQSVLGPLTPAAVFLVATIDPEGETATVEALSGLAGLVRAVGSRVPAAALNCVVGIGSRAWDRLFDGPRPAELHVLPEFVGAVHRAPSTPGDLLFHIRAERLDVAFEFAKHLTRDLADAVTVIEEIHGFTSFDARALIGFVDGTENPIGPDRVAAALVDDADPRFRGGSYVIAQKYRHDLDAWDALAVAEQERAIGRSKLDNIEMLDDVKPSNSHIALNVITEPDGTQRQILRHNMAFGAVGEKEFGTFFIGYAASPAVTELMLTRMFVGEPVGNHDRLLDFSTAITGGLFFAPPAAFLADPPGSPAVDSEQADVEQGDVESVTVISGAGNPRAGDSGDVDSAVGSSLGIGGLKQ